MSKPPASDGNKSDKPGMTGLTGVNATATFAPRPPSTTSINSNLDDDSLITGTALDRLLEKLDNDSHLLSPSSPGPLPPRNTSLERVNEELDETEPSPIMKLTSPIAAVQADASAFINKTPPPPIAKSPRSKVTSPLARSGAASPVKKSPPSPPTVKSAADESASEFSEVMAIVTSPIARSGASSPVMKDLPPSPKPFPLAHPATIEEPPSTSDFSEVDDQPVAASYPASDARFESYQSSEAVVQRPPYLAQAEEKPLMVSASGFMDLVTTATSAASVNAVVDDNDDAKRKRDTVRSLLTPASGNTRNSSAILLPEDRIQVTNLNDVPAVSLPGLIPESSKPKRSKSGVFRQGNQSDIESALHRKRSLNDPSRGPNPRMQMVVAGGVTSRETPAYMERQKRIRESSRKPRAQDDSSSSAGKTTAWRLFARCLTCYAIPPFLRCCGMSNPMVQQAWREKMALVTIIFLMCIFLGFLTFGFEYFACGIGSSRVQRFPVHIFNNGVVNIRGDLFDIGSFQHPGTKVELFRVAGRDLSWSFPLRAAFLPGGVSACDPFPQAATSQISCTVDGVDLKGHCHTDAQFDQMLGELAYKGVQSFRWEDVQNGNKYIVYNGWVINLDRYFKEGNRFLGDQTFEDMLVKSIGTDITLTVGRNPQLESQMACLLEKFKVGQLENDSAECMASNVFMWISLCTILGVVLSRFVIAMYYIWIVGSRLGSKPPKFDTALVPIDLKRTVYNPDDDEQQLSGTGKGSQSDSAKWTAASAKSGSVKMLPNKSRYSSHYNMQNRFSIANGYQPSYKSTNKSLSNSNTPRSSIDGAGALDLSEQNGILRTIMLVTAYSEGEEGIRTTLDSLALADFPDSHKMLFIIADGLITGSGNTKSTPDILVDMIQIDPQFDYPPAPHSYVAIADGKKRHNMAQVYAGKYIIEGHSVPTVIVVKCGTPDEQNDPKPGNRGKRDSQLILMQFLSKVMFDDRMTPLEFDLFTKMTAVSSAPLGTSLDLIAHKVTPDLYELVLMVDADTRVMPESMRVMSYAMANDPKLIGLCGETRIANKSDSWVTAIQVFEYFISHMLAKSFESVFGTVTCLPGCFCMYRVKAPKPIEDGTGYQYYVPILANPDVVEAYSENVVDTLHKKNLYLLGEDRYLTTLMLKTFPKRKLQFVPNAVCKTVVPDQFSVLLSQRRRWINSTFHNLLELVMLRDLCGIFCFSMQFVIFMEMVGAAVLPAAVSFTVYLIIISFFVTPPPLIPLFLLAAILGLPAVLIFFGSRRWIYIFWMIIYLFSLPIWNFVLPLYAYWHFDDFSWGETRKVEGIIDDKGHGDKEGLFDPSRITMKRWFEWEKLRRRTQALDKLNGKSRGNSRNTSPVALPLEIMFQGEEANKQ
eukprot:Partr_v1_DN28813_c0_g1_i1_m34120 putative chitin synthase